MEKVLIDLEKNGWGEYICTQFKVNPVKIVKRNFPDGETYLKVPAKVKGKEVIINCALNDPNAKTIDLIMLSRTLRDNGALKVGLIAPYLAYMRQDKQFSVGEAVSAKYYASLLSQSFDWLITVDPHLHRIKYLSDIFDIPTLVVHAAPFISDWIRENIENPLIIGPDQESSQWVKEVAQHLNAPFEVFEKIRLSDWKIKELTGELSKYKDYTPVLVDDIISTGQTMIQAITALNKAKLQPPHCIAVHGIFAENAFLDLLNEGVADIITCNTIKHTSNKIFVCRGLETLL